MTEVDRDEVQAAQERQVRYLNGYSPRNVCLSVSVRRLGCPRGGRGVDILGRRTYIKVNFESSPPLPPPHRCLPFERHRRVRIERESRLASRCLATNKK